VIGSLMLNAVAVVLAAATAAMHPEDSGEGEL
jgi:hypothetical protein